MDLLPSRTEVRAVTACQQAFVVLAGMECRRLSTAGEQRHGKEARAQGADPPEHPSTGALWVEEHTVLHLPRLGPGSGAFMELRWAEMPSAPQAGEAKTTVPSPQKVVPW